MDDNDWALTEKVEDCIPVIEEKELDTTDPWYAGEEWSKYHSKGYEYTLTNGKITAKVNPEGWISFYNQKGALLTEEYWRTRDRINRFAVPLRIVGREMKPVMGSQDYELTARFEAFDDERIYGMGQYQEKSMNKKGAILELAHRNSQASVPFMVSSRGYGFLWNNPAIGTAVFGTNKTEWYAKATRKLDYFITAGDTPSEIEEQYSAATGRTPMMPDPDAMVKELKELGIETVVSVWPTIDERSKNYGEMSGKGYLVRTDRGNGNHMTWMGNTVFYDPTHPGARKFVWEKCKENYYKKGIRIFWLDEAEPEYGPYDFDNYRYYAGPALQCSNIYPVMFAWGAFCPVFRMHGERSPWYEREQEFIDGVRQLTSGQDNEVWSFGEDNYEILKKYLFIRENLRDYIRECMKKASMTGEPVMRPLFFDFHEDKKAWEIEDAYMFGSDILVAPVMEAGVESREVYLPAGCKWTESYTGTVYEGGQTVNAKAPIDIIPVFIRENCTHKVY